MTRIGILATHPPRQSLGTSKRVAGLAQGLRANGFECVLLYPYARRPPWWDEESLVPLAASPGQRAAAALRGLGVEAFYGSRTVRRIALRRPQRIQSEVRGLARALTARLAPLRLDALQAEQQVAAAASCTVKAQLGIPVVADLHNVWAAELAEEGLTVPGSGVDREVHALDELIARTADGILVPNREMRDYFVDRLGADRATTWIVPTGAPTVASKPVSLPPPFRLVYSGGVSPWVRLEPFLDACASLLHRGIEVTLIATGRERGHRHLQRLARKTGARFETRWLPSEADYFGFLGTCHVGVVPWAVTPSRTYAVPGKMYDYFAAGLPVVATGAGSWASEMVQAECGRCVSENPEAIADTLQSLLMDEPLRLRLGANALTLLAREFSWDRIGRLAAAAYRSLLGTREHCSA